MKKIGILAFGFLSCSMVTHAAENDNKLAMGMAVDQQLSIVLDVSDEYRFILGNQGAAFDYIFKRGQFDDPSIPVTWYVGAGGWSQWDYDEFGVRVPLGVSWAANQYINVYGQVHPELDLYSGPNLQLGAAVGITYRF